MMKMYDIILLSLLIFCLVVLIGIVVGCLIILLMVVLKGIVKVIN